MGSRKTDLQFAGAGIVVDLVMPQLQDNAQILDLATKLKVSARVIIFGALWWFTRKATTGIKQTVRHVAAYELGSAGASLVGKPKDALVPGGDSGDVLTDSEFEAEMDRAMAAVEEAFSAARED